MMLRLLRAIRPASTVTVPGRDFPSSGGLASGLWYQRRGCTTEAAGGANKGKEREAQGAAKKETGGKLLVDEPVDEEEVEMEEMFQPGPSGGMEWGGPTRGGRYAEPTRFGDWERKGRCSDF